MNHSGSYTGAQCVFKKNNKWSKMAAQLNIATILGSKQKTLQRSIIERKELLSLFSSDKVNGNDNQ